MASSPVQTLPESAHGTFSVQPRMTHPVFLIPDAMQAMLALAKSTQRAGVPQRTIDLVHLRVSQINGCSACVQMHASDARRAGESDDRLFTVAAWREAPYFTDAERASLALAEAATRISDRADPVSDEVWNEAARYYDEQALAALVIQIAAINAWNRMNVSVRQVAGAVGR